MKLNYEDMIAGIIGVVIVIGLGFVLTRQLSATPSTPETPKNVIENEDVETGQVAWLRDLDQAKRRSADTGKPIFLLFQEIPG